MKREIKFRAWHKEEKILCPIDVLTTKGAFLIGVANGPDKLTNGGKMIIISPKNGRFCMNEDIELMQFTGLHDKNDKEIYEGDIMQWEDTIDDGYGCGYLTMIQEVVTFGGGAYNPISTMPCKYFEVIGNIYENPELFNK